MDKTKVRHGSTEDTWDGTQNSKLLANESVFCCWRWNFCCLSMYFVVEFSKTPRLETRLLFVLGICLLLASRSMVHLRLETKRGERQSTQTQKVHVEKYCSYYII